jgi:hypothetical protein
MKQAAALQVNLVVPSHVIAVKEDIYEQAENHFEFDIDGRDGSSGADSFLCGG